MLTALIGGEREKRRPVALTAIPPRVVQAVLAIEDRRYYYHPGVDPIRLVGAIVGEPHQRHRTDRGHQHDHAAAGQKCLPAAVRRLDAAERPRAERPAQAARAVSRARARHARVEGRDSRDVSERHAARAARVVRHFRGRRGRAAVLRQGRQQRLAGRSGDHGRRAAVALGAFAVQQPGPVQRAPQRRPPGDGRCRFHHGGRRLRRVPGATRRRSARARSRSAVFRRLRHADDRQGLPRPHDHDRPGRRRVHDAGPAPAADRAGRRPRRPDPRGRTALAAPPQGARGGGAHRRRSAQRRDRRVRRRPLVQPVPVQPRRRGAASAGIGLQAVRVPHGVRDRRRSRADRRHAGVARGRRPDDLVVRRPNVGAGELRARVRRFHHVAARARAFAQCRDDQGRRTRRLRPRGRSVDDRSASAARRKRIPSIALGRVRSDAVRDRHAPIRSSRTWGWFVRSATSSRSKRGAKDVTRKPSSRAESGRTARDDVPRDQHDAQRAQRGHRRRGAERRLQARRRRQDRHDQRSARRLVRRLHARTS